MQAPLTSAVRLGVVVPTLTGDPLVKPMLATLKTRHPWELILIDNRVLGLSVAASWNRGIREAVGKGAELVLVLNDDILLHPKTVDHLVYVLRDRQYDLLSGHDVARTGVTMEAFRQYQAPWPGAELGLTDFACFLIRPATFQQIGPFDENFQKAYWEDIDYWYRLKQTGMKAGGTTAAPFYHHRNTTGSKVVTLEDRRQNQEYFRKKWGSVPTPR